jgi:hypothetical protein
VPGDRRLGEVDTLCFLSRFFEPTDQNDARHFSMDALQRLGRVQTLLEFCREAGVRDIAADAPDTNESGAEASTTVAGHHSSTSTSTSTACGSRASRASAAQKAAAAAAAAAFAAFLTSTIVVWPHSAPPAPRIAADAAPQRQESSQAQLIKRVLEALFAKKSDPSHVLAFGYTRKVSLELEITFEFTYYRVTSLILLHSLLSV